MWKPKHVFFFIQLGVEQMPTGGLYQPHLLVESDTTGYIANLDQLGVIFWVWKPDLFANPHGKYV